MNIGALNNRFISLFNPYDASTTPKLTNQLIEKLFTLITGNVSNTGFIECLNQPRFIQFIFDNLSTSSIDNHIILASILLQFKPEINHEQLEVLISRLVTMFEKSNDTIKQLILSDLRWSTLYYEDKLICSFFSPLVLKDLTIDHPYLSDIETELEKIKSLDGKEKYLRSFIPQFLLKIVRESKFRHQTTELVQTLLAFKEESKYLRFLLNEISFIESIDFEAPILKYFYYQDFKPDFTSLQNIIFTKFQIIIDDFSNIESLDDNQLDVLLTHFSLPSTFTGKEPKLKALRSKLCPSVCFDETVSFDSASKDKTTHVPSYYHRYSEQETRLRSFQNLKHFTFQHINEHLLRTVERLELKSETQITGSSKYVLKLTKPIIPQSSMHFLSRSGHDWSVELQLNSHGLQTNEPVILMKFGKKNKSATNPFIASGIQTCVSGVVSKVHNGSKVSIRIHNDSSFLKVKEETSFNLLVKLPESLQSYNEELSLLKKPIRLSTAAQPRSDLFLEVNCTRQQLTDCFKDYTIVSDTEDEHPKKRMKLESGSESKSGEGQLKNYTLSINGRTVTVDSVEEKTDEAPLNSQQLQVLVSALTNGLTVVKSIPGQGMKTIMSSILKALTHSQDPNTSSVLVLTKNNYLKQLLTYILVMDKTLDFFDILDIGNPQYENKLNEVANQLDQLQEEFQNDDIYQLEQTLKSKFKKFLHDLSDSSETNFTEVSERYPLKKHLSQSISAHDKDTIIKKYAAHFNRIINKFKIYQDLFLFSKFKNMENGSSYPSKLVFSDSLTKVKDMRFRTVIITDEWESDLSLVNVTSASILSSSVVFFQSSSTPNYLLPSKTIDLKIQYTKSNEIFKALSLWNPELEQETDISTADMEITAGIEYVELQSEETINFKKYYQNPQEREFILKLYQSLIKDHKDQNFSICIFTISETQKLLLQQLFKANAITDVLISLPHETRSTEFDIVILGTVRTTANSMTEALLFELLKQTRHKIYVVSHSNVIGNFNGVKLTKGLTINGTTKEDQKRITSLKDL
ncbi:hypothetical protein WICPIJ_006778 [Wickerhamomyces pijperi]|uniref:DNA2/NAM7 helicase-like C-terminal domain-containing protein n=1 Tax=Wickerhamomyces pijperi TaxID=599730 RepID=A0A9P8Q1H7_WICPI|nr:hypothetical protein WICPIJ_006778 [Wickerhamomyces pijperi]